MRTLTLAVMTLFLGSSISVLGGSVAAAEATLPSSFERVERTLKSIEKDLIEVRHDIHRHPEVSGKEVRTSGLVARRLGELGLEVRKGVGGHGVVGVLRGARQGPVVALRADMDAMASDAPDPVDYRSETPGVRHICGHDVHTTVALGVAQGLAAVRDDMPGTVLFLFQPAEETATGARAMVDAGALGDPQPDASFAFHTAPLDVGQIGSQPGVLLAARDLLTLAIEGEGAEQQAQEIGAVIMGLSTITQEQVMGPVEGGFRAGFVFDSSPEANGDRWVLRALIAATDDSLRLDARRAIEADLKARGEKGLKYETDYRERAMPGVRNEPALEARAQQVIRAVVGDEGLVVGRGVIPAFSEDFGAFQETAPGAMFWLGVSNPEAGTVGMPHSPTYVADDAAILVGARTMSAVLLDYLESRAEE